MNHCTWGESISYTKWLSSQSCWYGICFTKHILYETYTVDIYNTYTYIYIHILDIQLSCQFMMVLGDRTWISSKNKRWWKAGRRCFFCFLQYFSRFFEFFCSGIGWFFWGQNHWVILPSGPNTIGPCSPPSHCEPSSWWWVVILAQWFHAT